MIHIDLFSGIGGFALAADTIWNEEKNEHIFVEIDPFCQAVLRKHWPEAEYHKDIREFVADLECGTIKQWENNGTKKIKRGTEDIGSNTITETEKSVSPTTKNTDEESVRKKGKPSSNSTEEGVPVAERQKQSSSRLTTKTTTEHKKGKDTASQERTKTQSKENSPSRTNSFAGTVTAQKHTTGIALTKYDKPFILTAGVPCQPASQAGRRKGTQDDRWLWPETFAVVRKLQPTWCILENVRGLLTLDKGVVFENLCLELEDCGYSVQPIIIPAVAVNAPHRRDRVWIVARNTDRYGRIGRNTEVNSAEAGQSALGDSKKRHSETVSNATDTQGERGKQRRQTSRNSTRLEEGIFRRESWNEDWVEVATRLCRVDDELSYWVDGRGKKRNSRNPRLRALGNAIVPAVAEQIMLAIKTCGTIEI